MFYYFFKNKLKNNLLFFINLLKELRPNKTSKKKFKGG